MQIALARIARQASSRAQVADVLARKGVPVEAASRALDRCVALGYLDDASFAQAFVRQRVAKRGTAPSVLRQELHRAGVADDETRTALEGVDIDAVTEAATDLVRRRVRSMAGLDPATRQRRLINLLLRRGHSGRSATSVVAAVLAEVNRPVEEQFDDQPE